MHDPCTVAFEIRYPWKKYGRSGRNDFERNYRDSFITIWHRDPEKRSGMLGCRRDDTCGWTYPGYTAADGERVKKLAKEQYRNIFEKQVRTKENASYAYVCYEPNAYDAIYWSWRALKYADRKGWQYGDRKLALSAQELQEIYHLAADPVDNLRSTVSTISDEESFQNFFFSVYRVYRRFHRPWYKHPRWHFWHWSIQLHPLQNLKRRFWLKCSRCGKRGFKDTPIGNWSGTERWHSTCSDVHPIPQEKEAS
jgi:hypothetical protein